MENQDSMTVTVHIGTDARQLSLPADATLRTLRSRIRSEFASSAGRASSMRLIHAGRLLSHTSTHAPTQEEVRLRDVPIPDGANIHVALGPPLPAHAVIPEVPVEAGTPMGVSHAQARSEGGENEGGSGGSDASTRMGFDRLRAVGLDENDVSVLRATYLPQVRERMQGRMPLLPGETEEERMRRMEDAWIREQQPDSELAMNVRPLLVDRLRAMHGGTLPSGHRRRDEDDDDEYEGGSRGMSEAPGDTSSLLCGILVGVVLGYIALIFLLHPRMSRKFKLGVVIGALITVVWMLTMPSGTPSQDAKNPNGIPSSTGIWPDADGKPFELIVPPGGRRMLRGLLPV